MASSRKERVERAFAHQEPDRTPLFEIFQPYHPIYWDICGRTVATDMAVAWDALSEGIAYRELVEAHAAAQYTINRYFDLDMIHPNGAPPEDYRRPMKTGVTTWTLAGEEYCLNPRTHLVVPVHPQSWTRSRMTEEEARTQIADWHGEGSTWKDDPVLEGIQALAQSDGEDWVYMGEIGAGTGVAFYPPFMLMWMLTEPELYRKWLDQQKISGFAGTRKLIESGCDVIAMGGDVSCDKGPFISPALYREFILPVIKEHVNLIHDMGAKAVYTSDGNHWPIRDDLFFQSGVDGYKEVDKAAGMTWERLNESGVSNAVCIIGNIDARHVLCLGSPDEVRAEVISCLTQGQGSPGGHILHASHSVHEDVKVENYYAVIDAYRDFFGMEKLQR